MSLAGTTDLAFISGKQTQWLDYLPSPALTLKATHSFCAVGMQDGSVNVYSHTGRKYVDLFVSLLKKVTNIVLTG